MKLSEMVVRLAVTAPGAALDRACVRWLGHSPISWIFARSEGVPYNPPLLLTTRGRHSGRPRTVVLPHFPGPDGARAIVGSRGGLPTDPHWARNLGKTPEATVHLGGRAIPVLATRAEGPERDRLWEAITERSPVYLAYAQRARGHRTIPVFVLRSRDGSPLPAA